jgi:putative peptidoglycan lipid II flippase
MLAYLTSKGLGVIRQALLNSLFGVGPQTAAYYAAFNLPDTLFSLVAGGAFTYAFIPVFLSYEKEHGQREVWRLASLVLNVLLVSLTVVVLIAELLAPAFVQTILVPGLPPAEQALTTTLTRIMLLHTVIMGLGTVATAVLNGKRRFLLPALATAIYDVGLIGGLLVSRAFPSVGIYGPTYGYLASAICQVAVQLVGLRKQGARYTWLWDLGHPGLREVIRLLLPNMLAVGIASIGTILEVSFASYLADRASIAALRNASLLFGLPSTLVAQVVGQALLPQLTAQATTRRYVRMSLTLLQIVGTCLLFSVPAAIALAVLGRPAIMILFQHGAFNAHATLLTARALLGYAVGLPGLTTANLLILSFYALKDARTPLLTNIGTLAARIVLIFLLLKVFAGDSAILAIPLAASVVGTAEALLLGLLLFIRLRTKMKTDKGFQRLQQRRKHVQKRAHVISPQPFADTPLPEPRH